MRLKLQKRKKDKQVVALRHVGEESGYCNVLYCKENYTIKLISLMLPRMPFFKSAMILQPSSGPLYVRGNTHVGLLRITAKPNVILSKSS